MEWNEIERKLCVYKESNPKTDCENVSPSIGEHRCKAVNHYRYLAFIMGAYYVICEA